MKDIIIVVVGLFLLGVVWATWTVFNSSRTSQDVACTADAKLCSDGSAVGRVGPACEFAQCPGETP